MADFVYNPAESIKQGFQQAGAGISNIFSQVIAQQQRDYNLAESAFQNIEALKKDVNIFGQKNITSKSNELLKQAGSAILKNGKLDYSKLGEIRQSISEIKDLKAGYDVGAKEYERMLQLGIANKDNLVSFEKFYKDLSAKMSDENLVKNPQDLQKAMADSYTSNLDATKMFGKGYLNTNPYQKFSKDVLDPKTGALVRLQGELPTGWTIDAQGNKIPPPPKTVTIDGKTVTMDYIDQEIARLKSTNPEMLELMKKQAGFVGQAINDRDLVKSYIDRVPAIVTPTQLKSKDDLKAQELQVEALEFKVANQDKELAADLNSKRASAASAWANAKYTNAKADQEEVQTAYDPYKDFVKVQFKGAQTGQNINLTKFPLGKDVGLNVNGQQGLIKSIARDENGGVWVEALHGRGGKLLAAKDNTDRRAAFKWKKVSNFDEFNAELGKEISTGAGIPVKQQAKIAKAIGTLYNLPTNTNSAPAPKAVSYKFSKTKAQVQDEIDSGLAPFTTMEGAKAYYDKQSINII